MTAWKKGMDIPIGTICFKDKTRYRVTEVFKSEPKENRAEGEQEGPVEGSREGSEGTREGVWGQEDQEAQPQGKARARVLQSFL